LAKTKIITVNQLKKMRSLPRNLNIRKQTRKRRRKIRKRKSRLSLLMLSAT